MKFIVLSRKAIEAFEPYDKPHIIISVRTPGDPNKVKLPISDYTLDIFHLSIMEVYSQHFTDQKYVERMDVHKKAGNTFEVETAYKLFKFVKQYADRLEAVIVHCDAGAARSPAIAAGLAKTIFTDVENKFYGEKYGKEDTNVLEEFDCLNWERYCTCYEYIIEAWLTDSFDANIFTIPGL